jgi:hypothetical protein
LRNNTLALEVQTEQKAKPDFFCSFYCSKNPQDHSHNNPSKIGQFVANLPAQI